MWPANLTQLMPVLVLISRVIRSKLYFAVAGNIIFIKVIFGKKRTGRKCRAYGTIMIIWQSHHLERHGRKALVLSLFSRSNLHFIVRDLCTLIQRKKKTCEIPIQWIPQQIKIQLGDFGMAPAFCEMTFMRQSLLTGRQDSPRAL